MSAKTYSLWKNTPGLCEEQPKITCYCPENAVSDAAVVIFPGGGYAHRAEHEGKGYAEFLNENGYTAFVVDYRVSPHTFPLPLLDARRAIRWVRYHAAEFGLDKAKIAVMGSSAGGHLAALVSTYRKPIEFEGVDEIDGEEFLPNKQILCYPVINLYDLNFTHIGSGDNLTGKSLLETHDTVSRMKLSPNMLVSKKTPEAFIWHTFNDNAVNVKNSLEYAERLRDYDIATELHIYPHGPHGMGLTKKSNPVECHVAQWSGALITWLKYCGW